MQLRASNIGPSVKLSYPLVSTYRNTRLQTLEGTQWLDDLNENNGFSKITNTLYNEWQIEIMKNIPRQNNSYDCGVFICQYAYCISKGVAFNFQQNDMINIGQIMKEELATGKLRNRLLMVPSVLSPQMALFAPSPIPALPPATLLLPPLPIPALSPATFSPPPTPIPAVTTYSPASSIYCTAESYVPAHRCAWRRIAS